METDRTGRPRAPWRRWAAGLAAGGACIYLSTWVGSVTFYWRFQRVILAQGEEPGARSMIWDVPDECPGGGGSTWELREIEDIRLRLPPGTLEGVEADGPLRHVRMADGDFAVQTFPAGFLASLLAKELRAIGYNPSSLPPEARILTDALSATPDEFRFDWSADARTRYASNILLKMLLLEPAVARRSLIEVRDAPPGAAYLVEYASGDTRILGTDEDGTFVVLVAAGAPRGWTERPGAWLR